MCPQQTLLQIDVQTHKCRREFLGKKEEIFLIKKRIEFIEINPASLTRYDT